MKILLVIVAFAVLAGLKSNAQPKSQEIYFTNKNDYPRKNAERLIKKERKIYYLNITNYQDTIFPNDFILQFHNLSKLTIIGSISYQHPLYIDTVKLLQLKHIKWLQIMGFTLDSFPIIFNDIDSLTSLELGLCHLKEIPPVISTFKKLTSLDLWGNELNSLPETLKELPELHSIGLNNNLFTIIPPVLINLPSIKTIILNNREGIKSNGVNENEIDYKKEITLLEQLARKDGLNAIAINVKDCETKKYVKEKLKDKLLIGKVKIAPIGICNTWM